MEKCIWCESAYELENSTASQNKQTAFCCDDCEKSYEREVLSKPLEFE